MQRRGSGARLATAVALPLPFGTVQEVIVYYTVDKAAFWIFFIDPMDLATSVGSLHR